MEQSDLFSYTPPPSYPESPGYKEGGTSREAAESMQEDAATLRGRALDLLKGEALTADEVAARLSRSILSIRPRISELRAKGLVKNTGQRRLNASGKQAAVWKAV